MVVCRVLQIDVASRLGVGAATLAAKCFVIKNLKEEKNTGWRIRCTMSSMVKIPHSKFDSLVTWFMKSNLLFSKLTSCISEE